ncbi:hypothetical protein [Micromonospora marina]|uniref:hypothetical protein n=1 Tax=Micromonospora marina TaxID=307120 RepID=UPI003451FBDF
MPRSPSTACSRSVTVFGDGDPPVRDHPVRAGTRPGRGRTGSLPRRFCDFAARRRRREPAPQPSARDFEEAYELGRADERTALRGEDRSVARVYQFPRRER